MTIPTQRSARVILAAVLTLLAACAPTFRDHGYVPSDAALAEVEVGRDSRDTIGQIVGRPSAAGIVADGGWYYVRSRYRNFAYRAPEEVDREVVAISFAGDGTVTNVERFGLDDGAVVPLSRRVTDTNVEGVGFLRQLFGNFGRFALDDVLGGEDEL